jgi:Domain of unknown function (DUF4918)
MSETFGSKVMKFYDSIVGFRWATPDVALLSPVADAARREALQKFCDKYYNDHSRRVYWLGINPSRVRRTSTGVPYTDGFALENYCKIDNEFSKNRELSSDFFYRFLNEYGGPEKFYSRHYAAAAFPVSILRKDKYCNYYDKDLPAEIIKSIPDFVSQQAKFGNAGVLVIIGSGKNAKILKMINDDLKIFEHIFVVEHPRYVMQYKSAMLTEYLDKFCSIAREAEKLANL